LDFFFEGTAISLPFPGFAGDSTPFEAKVSESSFPNNFNKIGSLPLDVGSAGSVDLSNGLVIFFS
jgi:hypothetical protein